MVSMNRLTTGKREQIIGALVEGTSTRATVRMTGAAKNTVTKLLVDLGAACSDYQDQVLVGLPCTNVQCDEIWAYCYAKQKNVPDEHKGTFGYGDVWTWTAICADTKLVPSWLVGERTIDDAWVFLADLKGRLAERVQLTTDGYRVYWTAVGLTFRPRHRLRAASEDLRPEPQRRPHDALQPGHADRYQGSSAPGRPRPGQDLH